MPVDWAVVERLVKPSRSFEDLVDQIQEVLPYGFVQRHYDQDMGEAVEYVCRLMGGDPRGRYAERVERYSRVFRRLGEMGVGSITEFVGLVETRENFECFYEEANLSLEDIVYTLQYVFRWLLPSKTYLSQLIDKGDPSQKEWVKTLREHGIRFTLDILERGRTREGRRGIAGETGVPEEFLHELVNRTDLTRMPFVSGSTVRHYCGSGYGSLEKIAVVDLDKLTSDMEGYLASIGKRLSRSFIELDSGIAIASVLPKIVEH